jgi:hypothetical protein
MVFFLCGFRVVVPIVSNTLFFYCVLVLKLTKVVSYVLTIHTLPLWMIDHNIENKKHVLMYGCMWLESYKREPISCSFWNRLRTLKYGNFGFIIVLTQAPTLVFGHVPPKKIQVGVMCLLKNFFVLECVKTYRY